jgi:hypothetical protein
VIRDLVAFGGSTSFTVSAATGGTTRRGRGGFGGFGGFNFGGFFFDMDETAGSGSTAASGPAAAIAAALTSNEVEAGLPDANSSAPYIDSSFANNSRVADSQFAILGGGDLAIAGTANSDFHSHSAVHSPVIGSISHDKLRFSSSGDVSGVTALDSYFESWGTAAFEV